MNDDILARLKATTKINGAYPRDIEDAIKEIERLRWEIDPDQEWKKVLEKNEFFISDQKAT